MGFLDSPQNAFVIFTVLHFTIGRTASVVFAIISHLPLSIYLPLAVVYDFLQIPVYGHLLESSSRIPFLRWVGRRVQRASETWQKRRFVQKVASWGDVGIVLLCALPIRGFGVLSATILSYLLGRNRVRGTILLLAGSILGILLTLGITKGAMDIW
jgi:uncharacterized membrane protein